MSQSPAHFCLPCHQPFSLNQPAQLTCPQLLLFTNQPSISTPSFTDTLCQIVLSLMQDSPAHFLRLFSCCQPGNHTWPLSLALRISAASLVTVLLVATWHNLFTTTLQSVCSSQFVCCSETVIHLLAFWSSAFKTTLTAYSYLVL